MPSSTNAKRLLFAQIHPIRVAVTAVSGSAALLLFSRHYLTAGAATAAFPTVAACLWLAKYGDLEALRRSSSGKYVCRWMTPFAYAERVVGFALMCTAAWLRSYPLMAFGTALVVHAWTAGLLIGRR